MKRPRARRRSRDLFRWSVNGKARTPRAGESDIYAGFRRHGADGAAEVGKRAGDDYALFAGWGPLARDPLLQHGQPAADEDGDDHGAWVASSVQNRAGDRDEVAGRGSHGWPDSDHAGQGSLHAAVDI